MRAWGPEAVEAMVDRLDEANEAPPNRRLAITSDELDGVLREVFFLGVDHGKARKGGAWDRYLDVKRRALRGDYA